MAGADYGGAEAFFTRLTLAFQRAGIDQRVALREHPRRATILREAGVDCTELPFGGFFDLKTRLVLPKLIRAHAPDVVLSWMNRATRFVPKGPWVLAARLGGYYDLKYYRHCDHLIGNTQDIVDYLVREGWPAERAHYLPNFVSAERAQPVNRQEFYTPQNAKLVLALGRLHPNKGFDVLLKALAREPDVYLWLAGEGPLRGELDDLAKKIGVKPRVRFLGWREDTAALFAAADVFVCPSRHEPLGNVIIEAWAQGIPVIAADSLGPGTLIEPEETGLLVPVDDPGALASGIRWLFDDPVFAKRLAENGHAAFQARFTEGAVVERYLEFFRQVMPTCADSPDS